MLLTSPGCCCEEAPPPGTCPSCPCGGPDSFSADVTGFDVGCDCEDGNTTIAIPFQDTTTPAFSWRTGTGTVEGACTYVSDDIPLGCGYNALVASVQIIQYTNGEYELLSTLTGGPFGSGFSRFANLYTNSFPCTTLDGVNMTMVASNSAGCTFGDTTMALTSVTDDGCMAGTSPITFSASGMLSAAGSLAGSSSLTFDIESALIGTGSLSGSTSLDFSLSSACRGEGSLVGSSSLTFNLSSACRGTGSLVGSSSLTFSLASECADAACFSETCCDRPEPESEEVDELPATLNSEITDYTCDCLDNISFTHGVACLTGIDGKPFAWQGTGTNEWRMQGDVLCDIEDPSDPGTSYESCELSHERFTLVCNSGGDCEDWMLTLDGTEGCTPVTVRPRPGYSCNPLDMTFDVPVDGCNCSPPGTPGDPTDPGVCDCSITIRIYE